MKTIDVLFNRNPISIGEKIEQPSDLEIKNTFGLWNSSYDDAIRYGGDITRNALRVMNIKHDRKNIIVDVKIHMLMDGWSPAIPGFHTDGVGRDCNRNPNGTGLPNTLDHENDFRPNHYHILVSGTGCLTEFINTPVYVPIPFEPSSEVYSIMSAFVQNKVKDNPEIVSAIPSCTAVEFDIWNIHTGVIAKKKEWRYLIRVCESDYYEPRKDLREVIRMQSQIYSQANFGW